MKKCIFLDFNGTVLDDVDLCLNLLNEMLALKGVKTVSMEEYKEIFTFPIIEYYKKAGFDFTKYTFEELAEYFIVEYTRRNVTEAFIYPDFIEFINSMKEMEYEVILCSASKKVLLLEQLDVFNINVFDDVIALSNHYAASKLELAKEYVASKNIDLNNSYFIGDTVHDAEVGLACGLNIILVDRGHQSEKVLSETKQVVLHNFKDVLFFIKNKTN
jgi:phosphoglycolate phosphatase